MCRKYALAHRTCSFVVEDPKYNYLSARFPPDAELLARRAVELVKSVTKPSGES